MNRGSGRWLIALVPLAIVDTTIAALVAIGSPAEQRIGRFNERRIADLTVDTVAIRAWVDRHDALPSTLTALGETSATRVLPATAGNMLRVVNASTKSPANANASAVAVVVRVVAAAPLRYAVLFACLRHSERP